MRFAYAIAAGSLFLSSQTFAAFADADPTFHPESFAGWSCNTEIASLPDDSVFVSVGSSSLDRLGVARMGPDGQRDTTWGQDGVAVLPSGFYPVQLVPLPQGGLLVVGDRIVRFDAAGLVVTSFGDAGVSDPVTTNNQVHSVSLQPDGGIVVLGLRSVIDAYRGRLYSNVFTRLTPQGRRDTSFGSGGYLEITQPSSSQGAFSESTILAWSLGADGTAEVASYRRYASGAPTPELHRLPADFSEPPGRLLPRRGVANWISPVANVDASGNLLFATWDGGATTAAGITVMMFDSSARLVESFGNAGKAFVPVRGEYPTSTSVNAKALWRTSDGGWLVLVQSHQSSGGFSLVYFEDTARAIRLRADGTPDPSFNQGQRVGGYQLTKFTRLKTGKLVRPEFTQGGCTLIRQLSDEARVEAVMVEYYHPGGDHYFMTLEGFESALLDANVATMGWLRTGQTFGAWAAFQLPGAKRLCRFYGDLSAGPNSHFYTPEGSECDGLRTQAAAIPIGQAAWRFEEYAASVADAVDGKCPANLTPVYRVYNDGNRRGITSNHRYMTDPSIYDQMIGKGWLAEGVRFCVPPEAPSVTTF